MTRSHQDGRVVLKGPYILFYGLSHPEVYGAAARLYPLGALFMKGPDRGLKYFIKGLLLPLILHASAEHIR